MTNQSHLDTQKNEAAKEAKQTESTDTKSQTKNVSNSSKKANPAVVALAVIALASSLYNLHLTKNLTADLNSHMHSSASNGNSLTFTEGSIASVANSVSKSVVSIITSTTQKSILSTGSSATAAGTGFILSSDGYIATNKHVVSGANKIGVLLDDGTAFEDVELIGTDPLNDFAIIKIKDAKDLTPIKLGDSNRNRQCSRCLPKFSYFRNHFWQRSQPYRHGLFTYSV